MFFEGFTFLVSSSLKGFQLFLSISVHRSLLVLTVGFSCPTDSLKALELDLLSSFLPLFLLLFHIYLPGVLNRGFLDHQGVCGRIHGVLELEWEKHYIFFH